MFFILISVLFFSLTYGIKGGGGATIFPCWKKLRETNAFTERLLDGKVISTIAVLVFSFLALQINTGFKDVTTGVPIYELEAWWLPFVIAAAWLTSIAPSMGEEHGAIGRIDHAWGDYLDHPVSFGRSYGVKKGVQRGVWIGALMTLATGYIPFICFSFLFVPCVFAGQEIYYRLTKKDSWVISEPIVGGIVYGIPFAMWLN